MEGRTRSDERLKAVGRAADLPTAIVSSAMPQTQAIPPVTNKTPRPGTGNQPAHQPVASVPNKTPRPGTSSQPAHQPQASNPGRKSSAAIQNPGVVPKRQWGEAKTVLVDPVLNVPAPASISDSSVSSTDPMKAPLGNQTLLQPAGNETLMAEPTASDAPSPFRDTVPLPNEVNRTQPVPPVELPAVVPLAIEESGSTRPTGENDVPVGRSKAPLIVIGVLVVIILAGLAALLMSQS
jgi:hypothetical protein